MDPVKFITNYHGRDIHGTYFNLTKRLRILKMIYNLRVIFIGQSCREGMQHKEKEGTQEDVDDYIAKIMKSNTSKYAVPN